MSVCNTGQVISIARNVAECIYSCIYIYRKVGSTADSLIRQIKQDKQQTRTKNNVAFFIFKYRLSDHLLFPDLLHSKLCSIIWNTILEYKFCTCIAHIPPFRFSAWPLLLPLCAKAFKGSFASICRISLEAWKVFAFPNPFSRLPAR